MNFAGYEQSSSSAEATAVAYCCKLDIGPTVKIDMGNDLFLRQILPQHTLVLHFCSENDGMSQTRWPTLAG